MTAVLLTVLKFPSPPYTAVMECEPTATVEIVRVAVPEVRLAAPRGVPPSEKVTEPVGVLTEEETVALSVIVFCTKTGFGETVNPAEGAILLTVTDWVT